MNPHNPVFKIFYQAKWAGHYNKKGNALFV